MRNYRVRLFLGGKLLLEVTVDGDQYPVCCQELVDKLAFQMNVGDYDDWECIEYEEGD